MTHLLEFDNVDACYGNALILSGVSLKVSAGQRVALLGRNGAGKTTFVNAFLGIADVRSGTIRLGGQTVRRPRHFDAAQLGVSVVPQGRRILYELFPVLRERAAQPGTALSGGQQQMLAIGRALMANPALLVLDEPSEGLAPVIVDELADVLNALSAEGTGVLLIEQNIGFVRQVTDQYHLLSKGTVVGQGELADLTAESLREHVAV
jgi:branched-chain amino acid transport system ATP-binding protein